jgi:hypothetical protein
VRSKYSNGKDRRQQNDTSAYADLCPDIFSPYLTGKHINNKEAAFCHPA